MAVAGVVAVAHGPAGFALVAAAAGVAVLEGGDTATTPCLVCGQWLPLLLWWALLACAVDHDVMVTL